MENKKKWKIIKNTEICEERTSIFRSYFNPDTDDVIPADQRFSLTVMTSHPSGKESFISQHEFIGIHEDQFGLVLQW